MLSSRYLLIKNVTVISSLGRRLLHPPAGVLSAPLLSSAAAAASSAWNISSSRGYRGEAGETSSKSVSDEERALLRVAKPKYDGIYDRHVRVPDLNEIPAASFDERYPADTAERAEQLALQVRRKRLVYRSKQRGWLEVDLLLGTWAAENVSTLSSEELDQYEAFVNMETIDIYNVITLRLDVPEDMKTPTGDGVVERIQAWARSSPLGKADPAKYKSVKTDSNLI